MGGGQPMGGGLAARNLAISRVMLLRGSPVTGYGCLGEMADPAPAGSRRRVRGEPAQR